MTAPRASRAAPQASDEGIRSSAVSGAAAAAAMIAIVEIGAVAHGMPLARPLQVIGWSLVGPDALGGLAAAAFGAAICLATSVLWALAFGALVPRDFGSTCSTGVGVGFALFAMMFMMSEVVPRANPGFRSEMQAMGGTWVVAHAVYGAVLGWTSARARRGRVLAGEARARNGEASAVRA